MDEQAAVALVHDRLRLPRKITSQPITLSMPPTPRALHLGFYGNETLFAILLIEGDYLDRLIEGDYLGWKNKGGPKRARYSPTDCASLSSKSQEATVK